MGLFSKKSPKPNPRITAQGIEVAFHRNNDMWEFKYRDTEFWSLDPAFTLPAKEELDSILNNVGALKPEMRDRMRKGLKEWGDCKLDDGESYSISIQDFATEKTFTVSWSGGGSWGDLGVDFTIKDQTIIDESWGD